MEVVSVELAYGARYETVMNETDSILANISIVLPESAQSDHIDEVSGGDNAAASVGQNAALRMGLARAMQYMSVDYHHYWRILYKEDEVTNISSEEFEELADQQQLVMAGTYLAWRRWGARWQGPVMVLWGRRAGRP